MLRKAYGDTLSYWKDIYCRYTLELPLWGNSNVYQQHKLPKIRKLFLSLHLNPVPCPLSLPIVNISNCQSVLNTCHYTTNCLYLYDSYISKFEFMNYIFANLVVAWLYTHAQTMIQLMYAMVNVFRFLTLFPYSNKMLALTAGVHKKLVGIANREDPDQTVSSEAVWFGSALSVEDFWQATSVWKF